MLAAETEGSDRTGFLLDLGFFVGTVFTDRFVEGSSDATLSATDSSSKWRCSVIRQRVLSKILRGGRERERAREKKYIFENIQKKQEAASSSSRGTGVRGSRRVIPARGLLK